jgi:hypothetical protein
VSGKDQGDGRRRTTDEVSKAMRRRHSRLLSRGRDKSGGPMYCLGGVRHKCGVSLVQALVWNVGSCRPDAKGESTWRTHEDESADAGHSGGAACSSGEGS